MNKIIEFIKKLDRKFLIIAGVSLLVIIGLIIILFAVNGGREEGEGENSEKEKLSQTDTAEEENTIITDEFGEGDIDPENDELIEEYGADVEAEKLTSKESRSNGIDVSKWQGKIDWSRVKESGIDFAYIRIGYRGENGKIYKDDNADYNIQQADKAGILVGVYFFSTAISETEALEEANWTLAAVKGYAMSYPIVYDCEGYKKAESRMSTLSPETRTDNALRFLETVKAAGYDCMFYGARNDIQTNEYWQLSRIAEKYKLWVAQYPEITYPEKDSPDYNGSVDAWQYTNMGKVPGIEGNVDMVVCYFTCKKAEPKDKNSTPAEATAPLTNEEKQYTSVNENVTAKSLTNLRSQATTKSDIVASLKNGETVVRIGIGTNGWSKLQYNGQTVYAITSYLTTDLTPVTEQEEPDEDIVHGNVFEPKNDRVTAKQVVNLRTLPTTDSEIAGTLKNGEFLERVAISNKGWSRLIYNGQTVYAVTSYLTDKTNTEDSGLDSETSAPVSDGFKEVNEQVTAKIETNLRTAPSTVNSEVVYTLKNGEFVQRIGVHTNGWSKLLYNGQIVYAVSSYLTTEAVQTTVPEETTESADTTVTEQTADTENPAEAETVESKE